MSRDLPPLNALRAFEVAARLESISRAADELHVTHGAVGRQIRILEETLGAALFSRQGRGLALTPLGQRLYEAAAAAFDPLRTTWAAMRRQPTSDALVLGCPGSFLGRWMIPRLDRLSRELPHFKLHLAASDAVPDPALSGLDAALLAVTPPWPDAWQVHPLVAERIGPVLSPRHPEFARLCDAEPQGLQSHALLHTASRPGAWRDWAVRSGLDPDGLSMGTGFEHLYYLLEAAVAGLGIAIAPQLLVADDIAAGRLVAPWGFEQTDGVWALCTPGRRDDPRTGALLGWLRERVAEGAGAAHAGC